MNSISPAGRARESLSIKAPLEARQADVVRTGGCHWHEDYVLQRDGETDHKMKKGVENAFHFVRRGSPFTKANPAAQDLHNMVIGNDLHIIKTRISCDKLSVLI